MSASVATRVQEILERESGRPIADVAWEHVHEPHVVRELYAVLRRRDPKAGLDATRIRFLEEERFRRDGKVFRREMYEIVEALGATAVRYLPYLVAHSDFAPFAMVLGRIGDDRAIPVLAQRLNEGAKGALLAAIVDALGHLRASVATDALIDLAHAALPMEERDRVGHRRTVANACLALGRIGESRAIPALLELVTDPSPEMESVVPRAIVALGWLGDGQATHALLPLLEGRYRNVCMYALARIADRSSASHVESVAARISGTPEQLVYPRLMLEALRSRLGRTVNLEIAREALSVVMANRFEATELHETALRMFAVHGAPDEIPSLGRRFLDAEHPRVRVAAVGALSSAGVPVVTAFLDRPRVEELYRREGVRGLAGALADPDSIFRHNAIRIAAETDSGAELGAPAVAAVRSMVAYPHYSEATVGDRFENTFDALESLARFHTDAADSFLVTLLDHTNVMFRTAVAEIAKVDVYGASERLREAMRQRIEARGAPRPTLPVARLGGGPWVFGPPIVALGVDRGGSRFAALGENRLVVFDADGTVVATHDDLQDARALAFDASGERLAVLEAGGRTQSFDARSGQNQGEPRASKLSRATAIAYTSDGALVVGSALGRIVRLGSRGAWNKKTNGAVAALVSDPERGRILVASGKQVAWVDERDGARVAVSETGATVLDVDMHRPTHTLAVLRSGAVEILDFTTLVRLRRIPVRGGGKVALARDGQVALVARVGREPGLVRVDLVGRRPPTTLPPLVSPRVLEPKPEVARFIRLPKPIAAIAVDPLTSLVLTGGAGVRVDMWDPEGTPSSLPIAQHAGSVERVVTDGARGRAFSVGSDGLVLQWDTDTREIVAGWPVGGVLLASAALGATGRTLAVAARDKLLLLDLVTGEPRFEKKMAVIRDLASVPGATWILTSRGVFVLDEAAAQVKPLRFPPKSKVGGDHLVAMDEHRIAVVGARGASVIDVRTLVIEQSVAFGKSPALLASGGADVGIVVARRDRTIARYAGQPLEIVATTKLPEAARALATDPGAEHIAVACERQVILLESDLRERARVRLEHPVSTMAFAQNGLLFCGGAGGEVSVVETER